MSQQTIKAFEKRLSAAGLVLEAVGDSQVLHSAVGLSGARPDRVVRPSSVEELAVIVPAAHASGVSLWTAWNASGNALVVPSGNAAPPVLLELSKMNRILAVDAPSGYALVEPGVSHAQLAAHLAEKNIPFWLDAGADADASIAGGIWERSFGYTAYGDRLMMQCGMELMHSDGSLLRTGMGALPGENSWQLFKYGFGPYADGSFTQTSHTTMTKVGFWISPAPPVYRPFAWRIESEAGFAKAVEAMRDLRVNMVVPNTLVAIDGESEKALTGDPDAAAWNIYGALYGLPKNVETVWQMLGGLTAQLGGMKLQALKGPEAKKAEAERSALMAGRPSGPYKTFLDDSRERMLRLCFALPIEGEQALDFVRRTRVAAEGSACRVVIEQGTAWRALLAEVFILFEDGGVDAGLKLGKRLIDEGAENGLGVVRCSPALQSAALDRYSNEGFVALRSHLASALA
mgnify:CR=1 FL=1|tara:strand:- start:395 stop:1771 length:1377 start_codon:yes stop_codon:yes gene_type:complete